MRVLLTTDTIGGVWTFTRELAQELLSQENDVVLVSFGRTPSPEQIGWCSTVACSYHDAFRYESSAAPLEWMEDNERAYRAGAEVLLRVVREFRPNVIHSSQFCFGDLAVDVPVVVTAHSDVLSWADACLSEGLSPSPWLSRYSDLVQRGLECCNAVTAPSEWMLRALGANFPIPPITQVIPNGRTLPDCEATRPRKLQAVTAGRLWDKAKNIAGLERIESRMPILVAGELRYERSEVSNLPANTVFLGPLSEPRLHQVFCESSVYLAPSLYEPFGLAPLEAALCGCAVVARDIGSLREVWREGALYFQYRAELEAILHTLATDQTFLAKSRNNSYRRAKRFTARRMADAYLALYEDLVSPSCRSEAGELAGYAR